jgi:hypothetical protein
MCVRLLPNLVFYANNSLYQIGTNLVYGENMIGIQDRSIVNLKINFPGGEINVHQCRNFHNTLDVLFLPKSLRVELVKNMFLPFNNDHKISEKGEEGFNLIRHNLIVQDDSESIYFITNLKLISEAEGVIIGIFQESEDNAWGFETNVQISDLTVTPME